MNTSPGFTPSRRTMLQLFSAASVGAMASVAGAQTASSLQDFTESLAQSPEAKLYVARRIITMEPERMPWSWLGIEFLGPGRGRT